MYDEKEKELNKIIFSLLTNNRFMFYGLFLSEINKSFSTRIPTACLGKHPHASVPIMIFNPDFWDTLKDEEKTFLLLHEVWHYIPEHYNWDKEFNMEHNLANIAFDIEINQTLLAEPSLLMPKGGMCIAYFPELKLKADQDSLYYYRELLKAKEKKQESSKNGEDSKAGPKGNGMGTSGCKNLDEMLDSEIDIHKTWDELTQGMSDLEKEVLARQISDTIKRAAEETSKMKGDIPVKFENLINKTFEKVDPAISWNSAFRNFIGASISTSVENTRKRPNRKYGEEVPTLKYKTKVKGIFLCDSSGSMEDSDMEQINNELYHAYKAGAELDYTSWDADVDPHKKYDGKLTFERTRSGGTRMGCAIEYINENYKKNNWCFAVVGSDG